MAYLTAVATHKQKMSSSLYSNSKWNSELFYQQTSMIFIFFSARWMVVLEEVMF